ncbi:MAG: penicillin-binding protein activator [Betaproteobacteria bacterium]
MIALVRSDFAALLRARRRVAAVVLAVALGLPAFSAAQTLGASAGPAPSTAPATMEAVPNPETATTLPLPASALSPPAPAIALVLPLQSSAYGRAAEAVRAGFLAAAYVAKVKPLVIGHGDGDVVEAFAKAKDSGAGVVVGPLVRDDLKTIAGSTDELPWTIALNQLEEGSPLRERMYTITLAIDGDARQLARVIRDSGAQVVGIIAADAPLQKRLSNAFVADWILYGGGPPVQLRFERTPDMLALLKRELGRTPLDAVLLALDAADAALVKPYVGQIPVYASSMVNDRQPREVLRDLDDVRFVEIPWLADPAARAFANLPRGEFPNAALDRLYALGIDAFRVAQSFRDGAPASLEFDGAIGHVALDNSRQLQHDGRLMRFEAGQIVPADGR